ncbi:MAG: TetR/AcrR family transcriptional regulator [Polyangiaceae bacterium]|nr:TetR/AcrR family transcriptional regulator [Polyangiaceae bacterium]
MSRQKKPSSRPGGRRDAGRPRGAPIEDAVLSRTLEELVEHGIEGASVERIARAAEVNKTSVYRRWPTKGALVAAALERVALELGGKLEDQGSLGRELEALGAHVAALLESPLGRSLARAAMAESVGVELAALALREVDRPREAVLGLRARAQARGEWRDGVAPETVLALLVGALLHRALLERAALTPGFIASIVEVIAGGLKPAGVRSE